MEPMTTLPFKSFRWERPDARAVRQGGLTSVGEGLMDVPDGPMEKDLIADFRQAGQDPLRLAQAISYQDGGLAGRLVFAYPVLDGGKNFFFAVASYRSAGQKWIR